MIRGGYWWIYITASGVNWAQMISGDTVPVKEGSCDDLLSVPAPEGANVVICLQGARIRTFQVELPRKNKKKFLGSIAYVLEDKLLKSPDEYHFVPVIQDNKSNHIAVAAIEKSDLDLYVSRCKEKVWQVNMITADYIYIESEGEKRWVLDVTEYPILLRGSYPEMGSVLSGELSSHLHPVLRLALENAESPPSELHIRIKNDEQSKLIDGWVSALNDLDIQVTRSTDSRPRASWLARNPIPGIEMNFLTGKYSNLISRQYSYTRFIPAAGLTILIIIMFFLQYELETNRIETEYNNLRSEQENIYMELFPGTKNLIDPRYQMEQALLQLQSSAQQQNIRATGFLPLVEIMARHIDPSISTIEKINYDGSKIIMDINIKDYESLEDIQKRLSSELDVTIESADILGDSVQSELHVRIKT